MFFVNAALNDISIGTAGLVALLGYAVVFVGLIALVLATWTTNVTNAYSGGLALSNLLGFDESRFKITTGVAGGIGTLGAIGLARSHLKLGGAVETIATLPMMIPELVLGMAYLSVFTAVGFKLGMGALVLTHTTFCIPYVFINVKSRLIGMDPSLSEAARDLGASPARVLKDIPLPLIFPAVLSGMMLSAAMSLDDVVISFFVTSAETTTLPLKVYTGLRSGGTPEINALSTLMLGVIFICVAATQLITARSNAKLQ